MSADLSGSQPGSHRHKNNINPNLYYWLTANFDPTQSRTLPLESTQILSLLNTGNFVVTSHLEDTFTVQRKSTAGYAQTLFLSDEQKFSIYCPFLDFAI